MGAWEELDTEVSVELQLDDLDSLLNLDDEYGVFEPVKDIVKDLKKNIDTGSKNAITYLSNFDMKRQEYWINKNCKNPSGMLASSVYDEIEDDYTHTVGTIINDVYPMSIEYGHKEIYPVRAKALAFYDDTGELIFRKKVSATKPRPFVAPAYDDTLKIAEDITILEIGHAGVDWD